jgi:hypothetical protein
MSQHEVEARSDSLELRWTIRGLPGRNEVLNHHVSIYLLAAIEEIPDDSEMEEACFQKHSVEGRFAETSGEDHSVLT